MSKPRISRDRVLAWVRYDAAAGQFFDADDVIVQVTRGGYPFTHIARRYYPTQHLVWLVETGEYPEHRVRFIDGNPLNTRFDNLRSMAPINNFIAEITPELILRHFEYDRSKGELKRNGRTAGTVSNGYRIVQFAGRTCYHRQLIWTIETGAWPERRLLCDSYDRTECRFEMLTMAAPDQSVTAAQVEAHARGEIELKPITLSRAERFDDFATMQRMLPENRGIKEAELLARFDQMILAEMLA